MKIKYIIFLISLIILIPFFVRYLLVDLEVFQTSVNVGGYLGFTTENDDLFFGTIPPGGIAQRDLEIRNAYCNKCLVVIKTEGSNSNWIQISDNKFKINQNENKPVNITVTVPEGTLEGNYNGTMKIYFWKTI